MNAKASSDDSAMIARLEQLGAVIRRGKSGNVLSLDLRSASNATADELVQLIAEIMSLRELYLAGLPINDPVGAIGER